MVVLRTTFSYIRGSGSHISLENIVTVRCMYYRGAIIGTAKIELAGNKVLRNDLAAPRNGRWPLGVPRDLISALSFYSLGIAPRIPKLNSGLFF